MIGHPGKRGAVLIGCLGKTSEQGLTAGGRKRRAAGWEKNIPSNENRKCTSPRPEVG